MFEKMIPIFKTGKHKDSKGNEKEWSKKDLETIRDKYNKQDQSGFHEAPLVIGHPKSNDPAYGWADKLELIGDVLFAKPKQVANEFADWINKGLYKKRSISLYPDMTLRHIGFLGAQPPAVKGLPDVSFAEGEDLITIEFEELSTYYISSKFSTIGDILRAVKNYFIDKEGQEKADQMIAEWMLKEVQREIPQPNENKSFAEIINIDGIDKNLGKPPEHKEEDLDEQKFKEMEKQNQNFAETNKTLLAENEKLKRETKRREFVAFCEENKKKILPAKKEAVINFMEILEGQGEYEFAEGDKSVKKNALEEFKEYIKSSNDIVEFGEKTPKSNNADLGTGNDEKNEFSEFADGQIDQDQLDLDKKVKALMKKEKMSYKDALASIQKEGK